jgi:hypothetical protein
MHSILLHCPLFKNWLLNNYLIPLSVPGVMWAGGGLVVRKPVGNREVVDQVFHTVFPPGRVGRNPRAVHTKPGYQC